MAICPSCRGDVDPDATTCPVCGYDFVADPVKHAAVTAMIPRAEGKPAVHVDGHDGSVFVCRRLSGLRVAPAESTFHGWCDWADPPEARPEELSDGLAISYPDSFQVGPGWFLDSYSTGTWSTNRPSCPGRWRGTTPGCRGSWNRSPRPVTSPALQQTRRACSGPAPRSLPRPSDGSAGSRGGSRRHGR